MNKLYKDIGKRIKKQRNYLGIKQEQMAHSLNISVRHYGEIERGISGLTIKNIIIISNILHMSTDYLLNGLGEKTSNEIKELSLALDICPEEKRQNLILIVRDIAILLS